MGTEMVLKAFFRPGKIVKHFLPLANFKIINLLNSVDIDILNLNYDLSQS